MVVGDDGTNGGLWCSPVAKTSSPTSSAFRASVTIALMRSASLGARPVVGSGVTSPTLKIPNCICTPSLVPAVRIIVDCASTWLNTARAGLMPAWRAPPSAPERSEPGTVGTGAVLVPYVDPPAQRAGGTHEDQAADRQRLRRGRHGTHRHQPGERAGRAARGRDRQCAASTEASDVPARPAGHGARPRRPVGPLVTAGGAGPPPAGPTAGPAPP